MRKVILSKRASVKLEKLLIYLESEWSQKVKQDFIQKLDKSLDRIKIYPESNERSEMKEGLYRCVVTRHTVIYYRFNSSVIMVITLFDSRMDPRKLTSEIK